MSVTQHPLAVEHGEHLIAPEEWKQVELNGFHNRIKEVLDDWSDGLRAVSEVSTDFKDDVRQRRQQARLRAGLFTAQIGISRALQPIREAVRARQDDVARALSGSRSDDPIERLIMTIERGQLRQELAGMEREDRGWAILQAASLGDRRPLDAAKSGLVPLVTEETLELAVERWLEVAEGDKLQQLKLAESLLGSAETTARAVGDRLRGIAQDHKLTDIFDSAASAMELDANLGEMRRKLEAQRGDDVPSEPILAEED